MKSKIKYILVFIFFYINTLSNVFSQEYSFVDQYNSVFAMYGNGVLKNGFVYVNGTVQDTLSPFKNLSLFTKINLNTGISDYNTRAPLSNWDINFQENCFVNLPNGDFVSGGVINLGARIVLLFYDSSGVVTDTTIIVDSTSTLLYAKNLIYKDSALYFLIIRSVAGGDANLWLAKIDLSGNLLWTQSYGIPTMTEMAGSLLDLDTCILIGASRTNLNHVPYTVEQISHTWLIAIDTAGNILNEWLDPDPKTYWPDKMLKTEDGKVIMAGGYRGTYTWSDHYEAWWHGYIASFDLATWNKEWWKQHGNMTNITYFHDIDTVDGGYLLTGVDATGIPVINYPPGGWLAKVDMNGDLIWERKYLPFSTGLMNCTLRETVFLPGGDMISVGWADNGHYHSWILRTDEFGCLVPGCESIGLEQEEENLLKVYPNPGSGIINFTYKEAMQAQLQIYDMLGKLVYSNTIANLLQVNVGDWSKGVYLYHIITSENKTTHGKLVVE